MDCKTSAVEIDYDELPVPPHIVNTTSRQRSCNVYGGMSCDPRLQNLNRYDVSSAETWGEFADNCLNFG